MRTSVHFRCHAGERTCHRMINASDRFCMVDDAPAITGNYRGTRPKHCCEGHDYIRLVSCHSNSRLISQRHPGGEKKKTTPHQSHQNHTSGITCTESRAGPMAARPTPSQQRPAHSPQRPRPGRNSRDTVYGYAMMDGEKVLTTYRSGSDHCTLFNFARARMGAPHLRVHLEVAVDVPLVDGLLLEGHLLPHLLRDLHKRSIC